MLRSVPGGRAYVAEYPTGLLKFDLRLLIVPTRVGVNQHTTVLRPKYVERRQ